MIAMKERRAGERTQYAARRELSQFRMESHGTAKHKRCSHGQGITGAILNEWKQFLKSCAEAHPLCVRSNAVRPCANSKRRYFLWTSETK